MALPDCPVCKPVEHFLDGWLTCKGSALYEWCKPWADSPGCHKRTGCARHEVQASGSILPWPLHQVLPLSSCPEFLFRLYWLMDSKLKFEYKIKYTLSSPSHFSSWCFITAKEIVTKTTGSRDWHRCLSRQKEALCHLSCEVTGGSPLLTSILSASIPCEYQCMSEAVDQS